jgi:hypothetical protein
MRRTRSSSFSSFLRGIKPAVFGQNLLLTLFFGVAVSFWILRYTDWAEVVFGLLALTSVFSWLALVLRLLTPDTIVKLQNQLELAAFRNPNFRWVLISMITITVVLACFLGTVQVKAVQESTDRTVRVYRGTPPVEADDTVSPGARIRFVCWTSPWNPSRFHVKIGGYPERTVMVQPFGREDLQTSTSFYGPAIKTAVLLRPDPYLIEQRGANLQISIRKAGTNETTLADFDGRSLWVNTDADVEVPAAVADSWKTEAAGLVSPGLLNFWLHPTAFAKPLHLQPDDKLEVCVLKKNPDLKCCLKERDYILVRELRSKQDFPQVEKISVPECNAAP